MYKKNQLIVGDGRSVTAEQAMVLRWLASQENLLTALPRILGLSLLFAILVFAAFYIADVNFPEFTISERDFAFLGTMLLVSLVFLRLFVLLGDLISSRYMLFPARALMYLYPLAAATMLVRFVLRFEIALTFAVCLALMGAFIAPTDMPIALFFLISSLVGAHAMGHAARRADLLKAGLFVGLINVAMLSCFFLLRGTYNDIAVLASSALLGGVLSGITAIALTPIVEWLFGYLTPISLLELANYEHPLLRQIMTNTPGTFQHSVTIGALAESAAERIGADPLLCRVGALYHDAGKSMNPEWFVENQSAVNPHDALHDPVKSAEIIKKHVTDGVALAREHKLGERIIDFILEHHGTNRISYFLAKAREAEGNGGQPFDEAVFRYDGPKPRSKETGIMIVADAVEAISRTMKENTADALRQMIDKTVARLQSTGQLDDAPLTQRDLVQMREAFVGVLAGVHRPRIDYRDEAPDSNLPPSP
ncbi:MAG: HDIG domain-containing protein [Deltaproteobacteria bacterium]|nr:HDIG domain-containing protein [Deltaproteobacteria bacterium]